jgi:hypothetical protein
MMLYITATTIHISRNTIRFTSLTLVTVDISLEDTTDHTHRPAQCAKLSRDARHHFLGHFQHPAIASPMRYAYGVMFARACSIPLKQQLVASTDLHFYANKPQPRERHKTMSTMRRHQRSRASKSWRRKESSTRMLSGPLPGIWGWRR